MNNEETGSDESAGTISIKRAVLNQSTFDKNYGAQDVDFTLASKIKAYANNLMDKPCHHLKKGVCSLFPFVQWLPEYQFKAGLVSDLISGCTVGIMNIPQGMAYGMLTLLPPQYGLYTSFFPPLIYAFFGTSRHISFGTFAVISLMVRSVIEKNVPMLNNNASNVNNSVATTSLTLAINYANSSGTGSNTFLTSGHVTGHQSGLKLCQDDLGSSSEGRDLNLMLSVAFCLTFMVGLCQVCFGLLQLGFVSVFLSHQLVEGLTTGAAVQVMTSQIAKLFGIQGLPSASGVFGIIKFYICFFASIDHAKWMTVVNSVLFLMILILVKEFGEPLFKKRFNFPLPIELIIVILATVISHFGKLKQNYDLAIVGFIPKGLPTPAPPALKHAGDVLTDALTISIVIFSLSVSMCKLFAKKHNYKINANQEWFAYGFVHLIASFFFCHCAGSSLSRSVLQEAQGGKSQIAAVFSSLIILVVVLWLAPLFHDLPQCALAAIIVVNLKSMFMQFSSLPKLWRRSKIDFSIWLITFIAVVLLDIKYGLIVGLVFALMTVIYRIQWPDTVCLGSIPQTELYKTLEGYSSAMEIPRLKIYRFDAPLYFANASIFKDDLYEKVGLDPVERKKLLDKRPNLRVSSEPDLINVTERNANAVPLNIDLSDLQVIIIDCSSFPYIDISGVEALKQIYEEYQQIGIIVMFCSIKVAIKQLLEACDFYKSVPKTAIFLTVHDAVIFYLSSKPSKALTSFTTYSS